ncbi:MAG TPA: DUF5671 domain-containing protein [Candidatus Saccharimonadales bacterium]|nr:DUF5671 domain-containing protein [Candidatus Saccharimonadales bacterium]
MANSSITDYIKKSQSEEKSEIEIRSNLAQAGWDGKSIDDGFHAINNTNAVPTPPSDVPRPPTGYANMWDAFEHILMFISLYFMSTAFAMLLHQFTDKWAPGVANTTSYYGYFGLTNYYDWILKSSLACVMVTFPLFAYFHLDLNKRTLKNPLLRSIRVRKQLIYFTLIITFLILVKKIIETIFNLLNGDVSMNFVLHLIITVAVSGAVFIFYLHQVKEDRKAHA